MAAPMLKPSTDMDFPGGEEPSGMVLSIQRMSTDDGPGLRTTVFLKGCSLACRWCHNPESMAFGPQLVWNDWRCIHCDACADVCRRDALRVSETSVEVGAACDGCGDCAEACPSGALERLGRISSVSEVFDEVVKDRAFYEESGGGITVSGGEPTLQTRFVETLLERCRAAGLHTAVDTAGMCSPSALRSALRHADLVLYDLKEMDEQRHLRFTGKSNDRILRNLRDLADTIRAGRGKPELWVRTPLIPGATATVENVMHIGAFLAELGALVTRWELCAFNNLAGDKYRRLGLRWDFADTPLLAHERLCALEQVARRSGVDPRIVVATGPTRLEAAASTAAGRPQGSQRSREDAGELEMATLARAARGVRERSPVLGCKVPSER